MRLPRSDCKKQDPNPETDLEFFRIRAYKKQDNRERKNATESLLILNTKFNDFSLLNHCYYFIFKM